MTNIQGSGFVNKMNLEGKKILFIGMSFYDYEECILDYLKQSGADVFYFSSTCYASKINKWIFRFGFENWALRRARKRTSRLLLTQPKDIDIVLIIKAENFEKEQIGILKNRYPTSKIILYEWDSLFRLKNRDILLAEFDNIYTFDKRDAKEYGLKYRPLFFREKEDSQCPILYDVSFVGLAHDNRYPIIRKIKQQLEEKGLSYKFVLTTSFLSKWIGLYITNSFSKDDQDILFTRKIPYEEYIGITKSSRVIIDICSPDQHGLTMRAIECIGLRKKIITTNAEITNSGLSEQNFSLLSNNNLVDVNFFNTEYNYDDEINKYSLPCFIDELLS